MTKSESEACSRRSAVKMMSAGIVSLTLGDYAEAGLPQQGLALSTAFSKELKAAGMLFDLAPFGEFRAVRVIANPDHDYSFAVAHKRLPLEVRYTTRILRGGGGPYAEQPLEAYLDMVEAYALTSLLNIAKKRSVGGADVEEPTEFDPEAVKDEFGADWGVHAAFTPSPKFTKYTAGTATIIFLRQTLAIGYSIYLWDRSQTEEAIRAIDPIFYAFRFRV